MNIFDMAKNLTPEVYERLKTAVETGKWPDGKVLDDAQRQQSMQLVMVYQSQVLKSQQHFSIGEDGQIVNRDKNFLKNQFKTQQVEPLSDSRAESHSAKQTEKTQDIQRFKHDDI